MLATIDVDDFTSLAAQRLKPEPPGYLDLPSNPKGDHQFDADMAPARIGTEAKPAAVLVPIVTRPREPTVLLTQRGAHLRTHSGQIAFPGGKIDAADPSPLATAMREAEEEIGLDRAYVRPLGYLDAYLSGTGYLVVPVVSLVSPDFTLALNDMEVAEAFEVPLAFLMNPANHELHAREWNGRQRRYYAMPFRDRYIWGVTAGIIRNLYERLYVGEAVTGRDGVRSAS